MDMLRLAVHNGGLCARMRGWKVVTSATPLALLIGLSIDGLSAIEAIVLLSKRKQC